MFYFEYSEECCLSQSAIHSVQVNVRLKVLANVILNVTWDTHCLLPEVMPTNAPVTTCSLFCIEPLGWTLCVFLKSIGQYNAVYFDNTKKCVLLGFKAVQGKVNKDTSY